MSTKRETRDATALTQPTSMLRLQEEAMAKTYDKCRRLQLAFETVYKPSKKATDDTIRVFQEIVSAFEGVQKLKKKLQRARALYMGFTLKRPTKAVAAAAMPSIVEDSVQDGVEGDIKASNEESVKNDAESGVNGVVSVGTEGGGDVPLLITSDLKVNEEAKTASELVPKVIIGTKDA
jgi:hypothetical protein